MKRQNMVGNTSYSIYFLQKSAGTRVLETRLPSYNDPKPVA